MIFILRRCREIFPPFEHSTNFPGNCKKDFLSIFFCAVKINNALFNKAFDRSDYGKTMKLILKKMKNLVEWDVTNTPINNIDTSITPEMIEEAKKLIGDEITEKPGYDESLYIQEIVSGNLQTKSLTKDDQLNDPEIVETLNSDDKKLNGVKLIDRVELIMAQVTQKIGDVIEVPVVPSNKVNKLLNLSHNLSDHVNKEKLFRESIHKVYFKNMRKKKAKFIETCEYVKKGKESIQSHYNSNRHKYHVKTNDNDELKNSKLVSWEKVIYATKYFYNILNHESLGTNISPFLVMYGRQPRTMADRFLNSTSPYMVDSNLTRSLITSETQLMYDCKQDYMADVRRGEVEKKLEENCFNESFNFKQGEMVLIERNEKTGDGKFELKYRGPFKILQVNPTTVVVRTDAKRGKNTMTVHKTQKNADFFINLYAILLLSLFTRKKNRGKKFELPERIADEINRETVDRQHPCPITKCNKKDHQFKYVNLFKHISNNHNIKIGLRTKSKNEEKIERKIIVSEVQIFQNNVEDIKVKAMKYAKQVDQYAGEFLLEAGYINDKQLFGLSQLIKNIFSSSDSLVALEIHGIQLEDSVITVSCRKIKSEIPKCYFINFQKDIQMYTDKYLQLNIFQKIVKIVLYVDDVCLGNALSSFKKNNMYTHICYKVLDDNVKCSNLEHYRSLGITKSKFVKPFKYHDIVQKVIKLIESTTFFHQNIERKLKIAYVIGDNEFMNILLKTPFNYRAQETNN
uniref:Reverse transcriptase domain-containing protein n=1 Tax=Strongyloides venezuelensis TaxID=75913 RepID=A0A0K0EX89_STRVS